jgi:DNA invertase Pin-like site-specific DNA recombinase
VLLYEIRKIHLPLRKREKVIKRVACLYRVSSKKQLYKNQPEVEVVQDDIPMQKIACHEFAERNGWIIVREESESVSGSKVSAAKRDAVQNLKKAALNKEFDVLLVFMFDRLGRIEEETPFVLKWFVENGIDVWSATEGEQRFEDHVDNLVNYIRFWQASGESKKISERVSTRVRQLTAEGIYTGGVTPFGYRTVKKGRLNKKGDEVCDLEINENEARYIKELFIKTVRDGYGSHRLAEYMNCQGVKTHNGSEFKCITINRILRNRLYTGHYTSHNIISPKIEELQIISDDIFEQAQMILDQRSKKNEKNREICRTTKGKTLLSGNIYCSSCGNRIASGEKIERYTATSGELRETLVKRYICYHRNKNLCDCDGQSTYTADKIDNAVMATIRHMFSQIKDQPETVSLEKKVLAQERGLRDERKKLTLELEKNTKQLEKLQAEIANSLMGESEFTSEDLSDAIKKVKSRVAGCEVRVSEIDAEIERQKSSISAVNSMYGRFLGWANEFDNATLEQKKMIVGFLIKRVSIGRGYTVHIEFNMDYLQFCS